MIVRFTRRAEGDLAEIFDYLALRSPEGARKVAASLHEAIRFIADHPRGAPRTRIPLVFVKIVPNYPYKVFYRVSEEAIDILHIRHASRRAWIA